MHMLYNSDSYVVVRFDAAADSPLGASAPDSASATTARLGQGGYEIVDKFARKEIFLQGAMAQSFKEGVEALIETQPSEEEMDEYLSRFASLMQQPVVLH
jgi:hypothetical protein